MRNAATAKPRSSAGAGSPQAALAGLALGIILCCFFSYKAWERSEKRFDSPPLQRISAEHRHTKPIEQIKVGDWVLAKDPQEPGSPRPRQVLAVHKNWTEHLVHIGVAGQTTSRELLATGSHPIWTSNRGWVEARELLPADALEDEFGRAVMVDRVWEEQKTSDTFNLTVDGVHTFYVSGGGGEHAVLVHNADVPGQEYFPFYSGPSHGNSLASSKVTQLYRVDTDTGEFRKWGITQENPIEGRYLGTDYLYGKKMTRLTSGSRRDMIEAERFLTETRPGPDNYESWAGRRSGETVQVTINGKPCP